MNGYAMSTLGMSLKSAMMTLALAQIAHAQDNAAALNGASIVPNLPVANGVAISSELFNLSGVADDIENSDTAIFFAPTDATWENTPSMAFADLTSPENETYLKKLFSCQVVRAKDLSNAFSVMATQESGTYALPTLGGCSVMASWNNGSLSLTSESGTNIGMISNSSPNNSGFIFRRTASSEWSSVLASSSSPGVFVTASSQQVLPPGLSITETFTASRIFAGPTQYPPRDYAAYGIVAFPIKASSEEERLRHEMICRAYVSSLTVSSRLPVPKDQQMVTVWPVSDDSLATQLTFGSADSVCPAAVENYNLQAGQNAIKAANNENAGLRSIGPFLIAWGPTQGHETKTMVIDLKNVINSAQADQVMRKWVSDIEQSPKVWREGLDFELLRLAVQQWIDKTGIQVSSFFVEGTK